MRILNYFLFLGVFLLFSEVNGQKKWHLIAENFKFPEGPAWDSQKNILYVSNCYGDYLAKIVHGKVDTLVKKSDSTISTTNGLFVDFEGNILACDFGRGALLKISQNGVVDILSSGYKGKPFNRPNDLVLIANGNIYFSDPKSYGSDKPDGRVFYLDTKTGEIKPVANNLAFPNGINISPLDGKLYVSESAKNRVIRFTINADNTLSGKEVFIELPGGDPDGLEFDIKGNLYVAHFGTGMVFIISPEGKILRKIKTPGKKPSNLEFGGKELKTLYLTEDETNSVYKTEMNIKGFKLIQGEKR